MLASNNVSCKDETPMLIQKIFADYSNSLDARDEQKNHKEYELQIPLMAATIKVFCNDSEVDSYLDRLASVAPSSLLGEVFWLRGEHYLQLKNYEKSQDYFQQSRASINATNVDPEVISFDDFSVRPLSGALDMNEKLMKKINVRVLLLDSNIAQIGHIAPKAKNILIKHGFSAENIKTANDITTTSAPIRAYYESADDEDVTREIGSILYPKRLKNGSYKIEARSGTIHQAIKSEKWGKYNVAVRLGELFDN